MSSEEKTTNIVQRHAQPVNIKLSQSSKGGYYWSIDVHAEDVGSALYMVREADQKLRDQYLTQPTPNQPVEAAGPGRPEDPNACMDQTVRNIKRAGEHPQPLTGVKQT